MYLLLLLLYIFYFFFFQAEDGIRDAQESRGLGDVYKRQVSTQSTGDKCRNMGCAASSDVAEDFVLSYGERGPHFADAFNKAVEVDDLLEIPPECVTRVKYEANTRHGSALGDGCE
eukprot:TRINITY_DN7843_c0_g1_i1.p2 TRINITY_DN7843_c0_g1~~TRINITY_DN7843_c0_g1_i1.p2  ORF type:complete len:116 (+),score=29.48 TRINITY_DN7843_c0_g1_i1:20-367(+)